jgi:soluble P-type ATPase
MMTVVLNWQAAELWSNDLPYLAFTKGAPLEVLKHCQTMLKDGGAQELTPDLWQQIVQANDDLARQGFRVLGLAARQGSQELLDLKAQDLEQDLIFIGLVAMFDPPRPEVKGAIDRCHTAGIKVTMVTGDYGLTAEAIARHIGLVVGDQVRVVTGESMGQLSDAQLQQILKYRGGLVFARMSPEHKLRLVQAYKDIGEVIAVTGDGVNDAPALRAANIGIAMGLNGTDVAREAADIVLTDDNFATIVVAIEQGRSIYQNIRKFMTYILASNVPEIVPFLGMVAFKIPPALTILQILAVDLGTDMVPALALGAESPEPGIAEVKSCNDCGEILSLSLQELVQRYDKIDIPPIKPIVTRVERYGCICPKCGQHQIAAVPIGMEPGSPFGHRIAALVTTIRYGHGISYNRMQQMLGEVFGLKISEGAIANILIRVKDELQSEVSGILNRLRSSRLVCSDETSARVDGKNQWEWVFQNEQVCLHVIRPSRGGDVVEEVLNHRHHISPALLEIALSNLKYRQTQTPPHIHHLLPIVQHKLDIVFTQNLSIEDLLFNNRVLALITRSPHKNRGWFYPVLRQPFFSLQLTIIHPSRQNNDFDRSLPEQYCI